MWETFETPFYQQCMIDVTYSSFTAEWNIKNKNAVSYSNIAAYMTYGTERANAYKILEDTLNLRDVRIYDTKHDADGRERRVLNSKETALAQQKQQAIRHAFLVCTHTDKKHIHNHIYWNSTALDCTRRFKNFIGSCRAVRRLSDLICTEHRLSVVENPQKHGLSYNKWRGGHDKLSNRDLLRMAIDAALEKKPKDFDALLALLKSSGYSVARKSRLSLRHENQKQSIRLDSLGEGYSEQELRAVLTGSRTHKPFVRKKYPKRRERATLIADIEAKLNSGKGYRYDQAMKVVKLKQMAKTLIYLEEKGFADFDALVNAATDAEKRFYALKATIKAAEARMSEIQTLRTHIMNYSKTRSVYTGYRKAGYSKKYLAEHEGDILIHKAAKKAFDAFGLKKLPTVRSLNEEFARLLAEKKAAYAEYHRAQEQMRELLIHKANAACLLGLDEQNRQTTERQREEK